MYKDYGWLVRNILNYHTVQTASVAGTSGANPGRPVCALLEKRSSTPPSVSLLPMTPEDAFTDPVSAPSGSWPPPLQTKAVPDNSRTERPPSEAIAPPNLHVENNSETRRAAYLHVAIPRYVRAHSSPLTPSPSVARVVPWLARRPTGLVISSGPLVTSARCPRVQPLPCDVGGLGSCGESVHGPWYDAEDGTALNRVEYKYETGSAADANALTLHPRLRPSPAHSPYVHRVTCRPVVVACMRELCE